MGFLCFSHTSFPLVILTLLPTASQSSFCGSLSFPWRAPCPLSHQPYSLMTFYSPSLPQNLFFPFHVSTWTHIQNPCIILESSFTSEGKCVPSVCMKLIYFAMCDGFQFYHFLTIVFLDFLLLHKAYELDVSLEQDIAVMSPPHICAVRARGELWSPVLVVNALLSHLDRILVLKSARGLPLWPTLAPGLLAEECARLYSSALWFPLRVQLSSLGWWVWSV